MANSDYELRGSGDFTPMCETTDAVQYLDERIYISNIIADDFLNDVYPGMAAMIGEEIIRIDAVSELYLDVSRGCCDTVPQQHIAGSAIWFYEDDIGSDEREHGSGETLTVKVLPRTSAARYAIEDAPPNELTLNWRFARPYAPGQMLVRSERWFVEFMLSADSGPLDFSWVHRDRVVQADTLVSHLEAGIGPEPGTTYWASIYKLEDVTAQWVLVRTEVGIPGLAFNYTWEQALVDFNHPVDPLGPEEGTNKPGRVIIGSSRDGLESWQHYEIKFELNNAQALMRVASLATQAAQPTDDFGPMLRGAFAANLGAQAATDNTDEFAQTPLAGVMDASLAAQAGQATSVYNGFVRNLFESPYTQNIRREGFDPATARVTTVAARPSDRLTDQHEMWSRHINTTSVLQYRKTGVFTPWASINADIMYLDETVLIDRTSFADGVPLSTVLPGQMALIDQEIVRVEGVTETHITIARGCADTIPSIHRKGARIWFFEAYSLIDETPWPRPNGDQETRNLEYKAVPVVYGPPLNLADIPEDRLNLKNRKWRPLPPAFLRVNGKRWFEGHHVGLNELTTFTFNQRNRISQGVAVVDHDMPPVAAEPGTVYRLDIIVNKPATAPGAKPTPVTIRTLNTNGSRFDYTYEMAVADGFRVGQMFDVCGYVTVPVRINAWRDGLSNWQGYTVMLTLPAPACSTGQTPGGGGPIIGGGGTGGNGVGGGGNGSVGGGGNNNPSPNPNPNPDPLDNNGGSPNGSGPMPINPGTPNVPPVPTNPSDLYWDANWSEFWAAEPYDDSIYDGNDPTGDSPGD